MTGGAITLALGYAVGLAGAATSGFGKGSAWLIAPVVGPFGALASRENPCPTETVMGHKVVREECIDNALDEALIVALLAMDGLVQATGLTLTIVGAVSRSRALVRTDVATVGVVPAIGAGSGRVIVNGAF
jgi:hypothetical protein